VQMAPEVRGAVAMLEYKTQLCRLSTAARITVLIAVCAFSSGAGSLARAQDPNQYPDATNKDANAEVKPLDASLHADVGERPKVEEQDAHGTRQQPSVYGRWGFQASGGNQSTVFWPKQSTALVGSKASGNTKNRSIVTDGAFKAAAMTPEQRRWQEEATGLEASAPDQGKEGRTKQQQPESRLNRFTLDRNLGHGDDKTHDAWNVAPFPHTTVTPLPQEPATDSTLKPFQAKPFAQSGAFSSARPLGEYHRPNRKNGAAAKQHKPPLQSKPNRLKPANTRDTPKTTKP
jgi:hypothetical protein